MRHWKAACSTGKSLRYRKSRTRNRVEPVDAGAKLVRGWGKRYLESNEKIAKDFVSYKLHSLGIIPKSGNERRQYEQAVESYLDRQDREAERALNQLAAFVG